MTEERKAILKRLIKELHSGASSQEVKRKVKQYLKDLSPTEIAMIEDELVKEGMPREELQRLCDVHLEVFREQLEREKPHGEVPLDNPVNILLEEHKILTRFLEELNTIIENIRVSGDKSYVSKVMPELRHIAEDFLDAEKHYLREENVLFPLLEKHGITEPPAIMWTEHTKLREEKKHFHRLLEEYEKMDFEDFKAQLCEVVTTLYEVLSNHFFKENNILFPSAMQVVTDEEWANARREFDEIGYCCFTPEPLIAKATTRIAESVKEVSTTVAEGVLQFDTGVLTNVEVEAILDTLPIDITFVDKDDSVKYFNKAEERVFVRSKSIIGRKVQQCHPQKSIHIVNRIVESFKNGEKDSAEFWIPMDRRLIYIRYFAVRDKNDKYLGTIEVTQDLTEIKKIQGEKRLLDWKD